MAAGIRPRDVLKWARDEWGLSRRQVDAYIQAVYTQWNAEANRESSEARRSRYRAMLHYNLQQCYARDEDYRARLGPDLRTAGHMLELIGRFEGVLQPDIHITNNVISTELVQVLQQHYGLGENASNND